jgi:hypothetical protein
VIQAVTLLLNGCGTEPNPTTPIPEQLYRVALAQSTNDCGADNLDPFTILIIPLDGGTSLLGVDTLPIPSTVSEDRITFSRSIPINGDTVVVLGGSWVFAEDRHTFNGAVTFAVSFGGPTVCTFRSASTGSHGIAPQLPGAPPGDPVSGRVSGSVGKASRLTSALTGAVWGVTAPVTFFGGEPCFVSTANGSSSTFVAPPLPFPSARNARAGVEEDAVAFRWQLYGFTDDATAGVSALNNALGSFETDGLVKQSDWFWQNAFDPKPFVLAPPDWIDFRPSGTTFSQSGETFQTVGPGYWFIVIDVYWYDRENIGWGWSRNVVTEICHAP